jgi:hypothetical protein
MRSCLPIYGKRLQRRPNISQTKCQLEPSTRSHFIKGTSIKSPIFLVSNHLDVQHLYISREVLNYTLSQYRRSLLEIPPKNYKAYLTVYTENCRVWVILSISWKQSSTQLYRCGLSCLQQDTSFHMKVSLHYG